MANSHTKTVQNTAQSLVDMVRVVYPDITTTYYVTENQFSYYYSSRGHLPQSNPKAYKDSLDAQAAVILKDGKVIKNSLWPVETDNELMAIIGEHTIAEGNGRIRFKRITQDGTVFFIKGDVWKKQAERLLAHHGGRLSNELLSTLSAYSYHKGKVSKCIYSTALGDWGAILAKLETISDPILTSGEPDLTVTLSPSKETYTSAEVQAILDENTALKETVERLENAQVWYVNALEVLSPLRYHGHQLLESPDRTSLQDALKLMIDKAEDFFAKRSKE